MDALKTRAHKRSLISVTMIVALILSVLAELILRIIPDSYLLPFIAIMAVFAFAIVIFSVYPLIRDFWHFRDFARYGMVRIHPTLDFNRIFREVEDRGEVKVLDTYIPSHVKFLDSLVDALNRDVKIKILVVNPRSEVAEYRALELGPEFGPRIFEEAVKLYVNQITSKAARLGEKASNLKMRYYSDLPCLPMYILKNRESPDKIFFSFFLSKESVNYKHFEVRSIEGGLLPDFEDYFDKKWEKNKENKIPIPIKKNSEKRGN